MPVKVSPLIRGARWSALFVGIAYGNVHNRTIAKKRREDLAVQAKKAEEDAKIKAAKKAAEDAGAATYYGFLTVLFGISLLPLAIGFLPKLYSEVIWKKNNANQHNTEDFCSQY